ncbi:MAG: type I-B CRISPR-associated protein Cas7/Cst2/DevR [Clostridia bacterium]|nr:type I-B CRISPR-associated protein Cas7/Cst2/DevR [Clostridia bacterium]
MTDNMTKKPGLTLSLIFEAESANYGEGFGNITVLKKLSRGDGNSYSYISRQAIRYNIINQLGWDTTELYKGGSGEAVVQFAPKATIDKYPEIDLFGYMKTKAKSEDRAGGAAVRPAVARLSNAIALESFSADLDFLTNMGLAKRLNTNNSIVQSEIHKSFYTYTLTVDLDRVGVDGNIEIENTEKTKRVCALLDTIATLYRDIKGRRENFAPVFAIGGVYTRKNPFFENRLTLDKGKLEVGKLQSVIDSYGELKEGTVCGYIDGSFYNSKEISESLHSTNMGEFFDILKKHVEEYYA